MNISQKNFNPCKYPSLDPFTGTKENPDTVTLFFKNNNDRIMVQHENIQAQFNYKPFNFERAVSRIKEAAHKIFLCIKGKESGLFNATKNLTRGFVALIPFIGNGTLYLYDRIRIIFYTNQKIRKSLLSQKGPILGIAFDGKVIKCFTLEEFSKKLKSKESKDQSGVIKHLSTNPLGVLNQKWIALLKKNMESSTVTRAEMAEKFNKYTTAN